MADLRFGTFLAPRLLPMYEAISDAVGRRLGLTTEFVIETDYENCAKDLNDVCFVCSLPYVMYEREGIAPSVPIVAPILAGARYGGAPIYFSDVIVHRDSPIQSFLALRGRSWAYNEPMSQSGYGITRYHLLRLGHTDGFFGSLVESGFHDASMAMVQRREVDGSAIDSQVLAVAMRDDDALRSDLRVVEALGPSTMKPVAVSKRLPIDVRTGIADALLDLHLDPSMHGPLGVGMIDRFTPVGPSSYDDIRGMVDACEAAGFMELR